MMKKLMILIIILFPIFKTFSQTDTKKLILLNERIAKLVAKEVVKGDLCKEEKKALENIVFLHEIQAQKQDTLVVNLLQQKEQLKAVISLRDQELEADKKIMMNDQKLIKRANRKSAAHKIISYFALGAAVFFGVTR